MVDVKTAFSKVKKSITVKEPILPILVTLETILNTPTISKYIPYKIRNFVNSKIEQRFKYRDSYFNFYGFKFYIPDYSAWVVLNENCESRIYHILRNNLDNTTSFIDVGAHVGKYTITMAKYCKEVIAIEADPVNVEYLTKNISVNGINNVVVYNCACYSRNGYVFFDSDKPSNVKSISSSGKLKIRALTLDSILNSKKLNRLTIKIDVEGAEFDVLVGAKHTIRKYMPVIVCECWKHNWDNIISFFDKYGYEYTIISSKSSNVKDILFYPMGKI